MGVNAPDNTLARAKGKLLLSDLWKLRGWEHEPARECYCPHRPEDRRKACSVFTNAHGEEVLKDFKSGDVFDAPALLSAVEGLSMRDACKLYIEIAGVKGEPSDGKNLSQVFRFRKLELPAPTREKPCLPAMRTPNQEEVEQIAAQRRVSPESVLFAASLGLLFIARWRGYSVWAVTDSSRWNCQFRRMDGKPFPHPAGAKKTLTAPGSWASWPIGAANLATMENVLLVEGSGDFLAAWHFITAERLQGRCAAVAMTGAANWIPMEAIQEIAKKRVRIFPHLDTSRAGEEAALRWETQIAKAGGSAHCFDLSELVTTNGEAVGDLNDVLKMEAVEIRNLGSLATF